jgi:hypothetical protein
MHRIERFGFRERPIDVEIPNMRKDRLNEAPSRELVHLQHSAVFDNDQLPIVARVAQDKSPPN